MFYIDSDCNAEHLSSLLIICYVYSVFQRINQFNLSTIYVFIYYYVKGNNMEKNQIFLNTLPFQRYIECQLSPTLYRVSIKSNIDIKDIYVCGIKKQDIWEFFISALVQFSGSWLVKCGQTFDQKTYWYFFCWKVLWIWICSKN